MCAWFGASWRGAAGAAGAHHLPGLIYEHVGEGGPLDLKFPLLEQRCWGAGRQCACAISAAPVHSQHTPLAQ